MSEDGPGRAQGEAVYSVVPQPLPKTVVLIGLMGAGKSVVGRRLANLFDVPFVDADSEIEAAAGCSIVDYFQRYGEDQFREGEARVIERLLAGPPCVLATGGGAWMTPAVREAVDGVAVSVWLRASLDTLVKRTAGRTHRPLLNSGDPRAILQDLMDRRYPVYESADICIDVGDEGPDYSRDLVRKALEDLFHHPIEESRS